MQHMIIDAMNVIGARPDGWWRDRAGALRGLVARLERFAASEDLAITVVMDGQPRSDDLGRQDSRVEVLYAPAPGRNAADRRIVELVRDAADPGRIVVVTSDRELARLVEDAGASVHGARWLLDQLDADA